MAEKTLDHQSAHSHEGTHHAAHSPQAHHAAHASSHAHPGIKPASGGESSGLMTAFLFVLVLLCGGLAAVNQITIMNAQGALAALENASISASLNPGSSGGKDLSSVDFSELKSTAHSIKALFPVDEITSTEDAIAMMVPTGTPDYGADMGISYDDPVNSLNLMAGSFESLKAQVKKDDPATWQRFLNLATKPVGISCEYCCGIGPIGIDAQGNSRCGCQHNPALLTLSLWLMENTDKSDAEVLQEVLKWKTLFFPKNMIELSMKVSGTDSSALQELPGMVGGC